MFPQTNWPARILPDVFAAKNVPVKGDTVISPPLVLCFAMLKYGFERNLSPLLYYWLCIVCNLVQVDPISCASSGMFVNLSAVMLRLCEPFLDANLTKRDKIDPKYVFNSTRLELRWARSLSISFLLAMFFLPVVAEHSLSFLNIDHGPILEDWLLCMHHRKKLLNG